MNSEQILASLSHFTGTESYYRVYPHLLLTDGVQFLAVEAGCFWLMDVIASHLPAVPTDEYFCVATLERNGEGAHFELVNDVPATKYYATQEIEYTDFPLQRIKLYVSRAGDEFVCMLPSEY